MTVRRYILPIALCGLAIVVAGTWLLLPPPSSVTRVNAAKIKEGMELTDVEAILGGPERDETPGPRADSTLDHPGPSRSRHTA